jgi:hypothetical protein
MTRDIPPMFQGTYNKAMTGKSRGAAIKAFCQECIGYVMKEVTLCTDTGCPLYLYRPYRSPAAIKRAKAEDTEEKAAALAGVR